MRYQSVEVWDPSIRLFHWLLVASFATAWWSEGRDIRLHILAGTLLAGLLLFRLIWGFIGDRHARFSHFLPTRKAVSAHLRGLLRLQPGNDIGHTPLGSLMIFTLLGSLLLLVLSGMALLGMQMGIGLLAQLLADAGFATELWIQAMHGWCMDLLLALVALHLAGVVAESLLQRCNLVTAMITGKKTIKEVKP